MLGAGAGGPSRRVSFARKSLAARSYCNTTYKWSCGSDLVWLCTATPTPQLLFATQPCSTLPHSFIVKNPGA